MKAYAQQDFSGAVAHLQAAKSKLPQLADYTGYYLAVSKAEMHDPSGVIAELSVFHAAQRLISPLGAKANMLEAQARLQQQQPGEAIRLLRQEYESLPQPDGAMLLAQAYEAQGERAPAAALYQKVYFSYPATRSAVAAATAIERLKTAMGKDYPPADPTLMLDRGDQWVAVKQFEKAKQEYKGLASSLVGLPHDQAEVRVGASDYLAGDARGASQYLRSLNLAHSEADAERLYYLMECLRKLGADVDMLVTVRELDKRYPKSVWRLKALVSAGNRYLLSNHPEQYTPLYKAAYETFPDDASTAYCHWKVTWDAYLKGAPESEELLRQQLLHYPADQRASSALYFLGRLSENAGKPDAARAYYSALVETFPHYYYGVLAAYRLEDKTIASVAPSGTVTHWLNTIAFPERPDLANEAATPATKARMERARLLSTAGFPDWSQFELRFGGSTDGQRHLLAVEMARLDPTPALSLRHMKNFAPEYLSLALDHAPREFWEYLFPMPYQAALIEAAKAQNLDPYLVAGLIRQESEFNPVVVSHANAYGLMQLIPSTGRMMAQQGGMAFQTGMLLQPEANLKLGSSYLRLQINRWNGNLEQTLAAYNAGPGRVTEWLARGTFREPAEFVESIPFTETREYVQAVMRNAFVYRKLYGQKLPPASPVQMTSAVPSNHVVVRPAAPARAVATSRPAAKRVVATRKPIRKKHSRTVSERAD